MSNTDKTTPPTAGPYQVLYDPTDKWHKYRIYGQSVLASAPIANVLGSENSAAEATARLLASSWDFRAACHAPDGTSRLTSLGYMIDERVNILKAHGFDADNDGLVSDGRELLASLRAAVAKSQGGGRTP